MVLFGITGYILTLWLFRFLRWLPASGDSISSILRMGSKFRRKRRVLLPRFFAHFVGLPCLILYYYIYKNISFVAILCFWYLFCLALMTLWWCFFSLLYENLTARAYCYQRSLMFSEVMGDLSYAERRFNVAGGEKTTATTCLERDDILRHFSSRISWFVFSLPAKRIVVVVFWYVPFLARKWFHKAGRNGMMMNSHSVGFCRLVLSSKTSAMFSGLLCQRCRSVEGASRKRKWCSWNCLHVVERFFISCSKSAKNSTSVWSWQLLGEKEICCKPWSPWSEMTFPTEPRPPLALEVPKASWTTPKMMTLEARFKKGPKRLLLFRGFVGNETLPSSAFWDYFHKSWNKKIRHWTTRIQGKVEGFSSWLPRGLWSPKPGWEVDRSQQYHHGVYRWVGSNGQLKQRHQHHEWHDAWQPWMWDMPSWWQIACFCKMHEILLWGSVARFLETRNTLAT